MPKKLAALPYVYLHGMDKDDLALYKDRLDRLFNIINSADDNDYDAQAQKAHYRIHVNSRATASGKPAIHDVFASIIEMEGASAPLIRFEVIHSDDTADYHVCEMLRANEPAPDVSNFDEVLDWVERMIEEAANSFTKQGMIGPKVLNRVEQAETNASNLLNAIIHAYLEFGESEIYAVEITPRSPYGPALFEHVVGDARYRFLSAESNEALDALMPQVIKLQYSALNSLCKYWLGPAGIIPFEVSAKTLPEEAEIVKTLRKIADFPAPHLLDDPLLVTH